MDMIDASRIKALSKDTKSTLKRIRSELGLTQTEMAKQIGVSQGRYSKWERGINIPSGGYMERILALGGVDRESPLGAGVRRGDAVPVAGAVCEGVWRDPRAPQVAEYESEISASSIDDPSKAVAYYIADNSVIDLAAGGSYAVCEIVESSDEIHDGHPYVIERTSAEGAVETTIRYARVHSDGIFLYSLTGASEGVRMDSSMRAVAEVRSFIRYL